MPTGAIRAFTAKFLKAVYKCENDNIGGSLKKKNDSKVADLIWLLKKCIEIFATECVNICEGL